jgi:hypothetical protein
LVRNPDGYRSETDGTYGYEFNRDLASGKLEILPEEWAVLGVRGTGMFVVAPNLCPVAAGPSVHPFMLGG